MSDELRPANDELADYIMMWIENFDGDGLIVVDSESMRKELSKSDFAMLRGKFDHPMYNSIDEWAKDN